MSLAQGLTFCDTPQGSSKPRPLPDVQEDPGNAQGRISVSSCFLSVGHQSVEGDYLGVYQYKVKQDPLYFMKGLQGKGKSGFLAGGLLQKWGGGRRQQWWCCFVGQLFPKVTKHTWSPPGLMKVTHFRDFGSLDAEQSWQPVTLSSIPGNSAGRCSKHCGCQDRAGWIWGRWQLAQPEVFVRLTNGYLHVTSLEHDTCICLDKPRVQVSSSPGCPPPRAPLPGGALHWAPPLLPAPHQTLRVTRTTSIFKVCFLTSPAHTP